MQNLLFGKYKLYVLFGRKLCNIGIPYIKSGKILYFVSAKFSFLYKIDSLLKG